VKLDGVQGKLKLLRQNPSIATLIHHLRTAGSESFEQPERATRDLELLERLAFPNGIELDPAEDRPTRRVEDADLRRLLAYVYEPSRRELEERRELGRELFRLDADFVGYAERLAATKRA
jgi:hypothetical protein